MQTIDCRPGYRSIYGATTKQATEASDSTGNASKSRDGVGGKTCDLKR
jgi:hypothetical protein